VTAQRPGEVALAAWEEFDLENRVWTIPQERSKNGQVHQVPPPTTAWSIAGSI
jgi:integrase